MRKARCESLVDTLEIMSLFQPERVHDLEFPLQAAGGHAGRVLVVLAVQSPMRQRCIDGTYFCHKWREAMEHLLRIPGVFDRYRKDTFSNFAAQCQIGGRRQPHQNSAVVISDLCTVARREG